MRTRSRSVSFDRNVDSKHCEDQLSTGIVLIRDYEPDERTTDDVDVVASDVFAEPPDAPRSNAAAETTRRDNESFKFGGSARITPRLPLRCSPDKRGRSALA